MLKRTIWISLAVLVLALGALAISAYDALGTVPTDADKTRFGRSPQFNAETGLFENRTRGLYQKMNARIDAVSMMYDLFTADNLTPNKPLPEEVPDMVAFLRPSSDIKVLWFGHSSFLLNLSGTIVLVDPVLSAYASPVFFFSRRFQPVVVAVEDLPPIDYIVLSHDHYDHLDLPTMEHFVGTNTRFLCPLGVGGHLRGWGIAADNITELDWWESAARDSIDFTATPAQHFSGRDWIHNNSTLWASWVIRTDSHTVFFSGDSGYDVHYKQIGDRFGPFDIAFLETGQYNEKWKEIHMMPEQGAQAYRDLGAKRYFPVHWGMFPLSLHAWYDPIQRIHTFSEQGTVNLVAPMIGEVIEVNDSYILDTWWRSHIQHN